MGATRKSPLDWSATKQYPKGLQASHVIKCNHNWLSHPEINKQQRLLVNISINKANMRDKITRSVSTRASNLSKQNKKTALQRITILDPTTEWFEIKQYNDKSQSQWRTSSSSLPSYPRSRKRLHWAKTARNVWEWLWQKRRSSPHGIHKQMQSWNMFIKQ